MTKAEQNTISRILKVNHAGEFGAIRIYRSQIMVARCLYTEAVEFLEETLEHEKVHCQKFRAAMNEYNTRPCRVMSLWSTGGFVLGFFTALMGRQGIWICTQAIERTVHQHLEDQLHFLKDRDKDLHDLIANIQTEELLHLDYAEERLGSTSWPHKALGSLIVVATEIAIWLSTWGDSVRMAREIRA